MENSKFVLGSKYDLRTTLILLIGANILIFLGFDLIYQSLIVRRKPPVRLGVQYSFSDEKPTKNLL